MQYATNIHTTLIIELRGKLGYRHLNLVLTSTVYPYCAFVLWYSIKHSRDITILA